MTAADRLQALLDAGVPPQDACDQVNDEFALPFGAQAVYYPTTNTIGLPLVYFFHDAGGWHQHVRGPEGKSPGPLQSLDVGSYGLVPSERTLEPFARTFGGSVTPLHDTLHAATTVLEAEQRLDLAGVFSGDLAALEDAAAPNNQPLDTTALVAAAAAYKRLPGALSALTQLLPPDAFNEDLTKIDLHPPHVPGVIYPTGPGGGGSPSPEPPPSPSPLPSPSPSPTPSPSPAPSPEPLPFVPPDAGGGGGGRFHESAAAAAADASVTIALVAASYPLVDDWNKLRPGDSGGAFASDPLLQQLAALVGPTANWQAFNPRAGARVL